MDILSISREIVLKWKPQDLIDDKSQHTIAIRIL